MKSTYNGILVKVLTPKEKLSIVGGKISGNEGRDSKISGNEGRDSKK